jgi:hypothetical protein
MIKAARNRSVMMTAAKLKGTVHDMVLYKTRRIRATLDSEDMEGLDMDEPAFIDGEDDLRWHCKFRIRSWHQRKQGIWKWRIVEKVYACNANPAGLSIF